MENAALVCAACHSIVRPTDYFCFNCGKNLKPRPPSTSVQSQFMLYLGSLFLPPMGIIWGLRYLRQSDRKSKIIGIVSMVITLAVLWIGLKATMDMINAVNDVMDSQLQGIQGL